MSAYRVPLPAEPRCLHRVKRVAFTNGDGPYDAEVTCQRCGKEWLEMRDGDRTIWTVKR